MQWMILSLHFQCPDHRVLKAQLSPRQLEEWWYVLLNWNRMQQGDKGAFIAFTQRRDGMTPKQLLERYIADGGTGGMD